MLTREEYEEIEQRAEELRQSFIECEACYAQEPPGEEIKALMKIIK